MLGDIPIDASYKVIHGMGYQETTIGTVHKGATFGDLFLNLIYWLCLI
jgi:hypothetical protein